MKNINETVAVELDNTETANDERAIKPSYIHEFSEPFLWMGKTYKTLDFDFDKLKGSDAMSIYRELQMSGIMVVSARTSPDYQARLASRACGLGIDAFDSMPLRDFEVIISKARNFIPSAALL
ncbi:MAG: hypothetical protein RR394_02700 [Oscillospiraceae bacterium]